MTSFGFLRTAALLTAVPVLIGMASGPLAQPDTARPDLTPAAHTAALDDTAARNPVVVQADGHTHSHAPNANANPTAFAVAPTHVDPAPPGVDPTVRLSPKALLRAAGLADQPTTAASVNADGTTTPSGTSDVTGFNAHATTRCEGTGSDGLRVQAMYVREQGKADNYATYLAGFRNEIANTDDAFAGSAQATGGVRRVRWVCDPNTGLPVIPNVVVPAGALNTWAGTKDALVKLGYTTPGRKYSMFADAAVLCGIADYYDSSKKTANPNDDSRFVLYARTDTRCWFSKGKDYRGTFAHEVMHTLGAVQADAPHTTNAGHCNDSYEIMCYKDGGTAEAQSTVCALSHSSLFDCKKDDYFHTNPPAGNYLATHWNTADSSWLMRSVTADPPPAAAAATVDVTGPSSIESGRSGTVTASTTNAVSHTWKDDRGWLGATSATSAQVNVPAGATGSVTVTLTVKNSDGLAASDSVTITVTAPPPAAAATVNVTGPASIESGKSGTVTASTTNAVSHTWADDRGWLGGTNATSAQVNVPAGATGSVTVTLTVKNSDGKAASDSVTIMVTAPTVLSPILDPAKETVVKPVEEPIMEQVAEPTGPAAAQLFQTFTRGTTPTLTAVLTNATAGTPLVGAKVVVQSRTSGTDWTALATITTGDNGTAMYAGPMSTTVSWRLVYAGTSTSAPVTGPAVRRATQRSDRLGTTTISALT